MPRSSDLSSFWPELSTQAILQKVKVTPQPTRLAAVSLTLRPITFSNMDLVTVCALAIVVVLLITIVFLGGWFR